MDLPCFFRQKFYEHFLSFTEFSSLLSSVDFEHILHILDIHLLIEMIYLTSIN